MNYVGMAIALDLGGRDDMTITAVDLVTRQGIVVTKDVPDRCVVVGIPAYIVRRDGLKTHQPL
ncbi:hypothetical protein [Prochlorothrix hollandica]|uniref:Uncharacterized protein n=1 Tax=Prochlorothrix hollandica PCC 9006 = CALU 1027 TaxID=317619 RepID=A0A0M2Q380_PROHO|nr:hypothetical protein [Prochlorothrix hollandica]KKJ01399.1 hypothetical protein PROH_03405 [Prochlorothrix hollandica PCC 9006 = CALU 1027]